MATWLCANWLEVIKAVAPVATAVIAFYALRNWKRQDKAKREAEFLDALIEAVHAFIAKMRSPITHMEIAKIGMANQGPTGEKDGDPAVNSAIAYICLNAERTFKRLQDALNDAQPSVIQLRTLAAKGQVFGFNDYAKCQNAVTMLTWQYDRLEAFMAVIGSPSWNWKNPEVLKRLKDVMAIEPDEIRKSIGENNVAVLEYAEETYKHIYG